MQSRKVFWSQVDLPVPRGPKRKKWPGGAWKKRRIVAINASVSAVESPILQ